MVLTTKMLIAALLLAAWLCLALWSRLSSIDTNSATTITQLYELQQRMDTLERRMSKLSDELDQATTAIHATQPELAQTLRDIKTMLEEALPALRADVGRLAGASTGRR